MASSTSAALAQWQRIEALVQAWLDERQQLIVLLCTMQGLKGLSTPQPYDNPQPMHRQVQRFVQLLMDYSLSLIHIVEPTRLSSISYAVFCFKKKTKHDQQN